MNIHISNVTSSIYVTQYFNIYVILCSFFSKVYQDHTFKKEIYYPKYKKRTAQLRYAFEKSQFPIIKVKIYF